MAPQRARRNPHRSQRVADTVQEELSVLDRVLCGDRSAWMTFCQRYENLIVGCVLRALRRYNATFNSEDLADMVAEVWVTLLRDDMRKLRLYDAERGYRLASWLGLIATNCTIDQLRLRNSDTSYLEDMACADQLLVDSACPDKGIEQQETAQMARRALGRLSTEERQFVLHCYHEERSPAELARTLGISINTVYSRKFKIREKLVRIIAELDTPSQPMALAA